MSDPAHAALKLAGALIDKALKRAARDLAVEIQSGQLRPFKVETQRFDETRARRTACYVIPWRTLPALIVLTDMLGGTTFWDTMLICALEDLICAALKAETVDETSAIIEDCVGLFPTRPGSAAIKVDHIIDWPEEQ